MRRRFLDRWGRWFRYGIVSLVATASSLTVLGALVSTTTIPAALANVMATAVGAVPSFELNRRWVWRRTGPRSVRAEVVPFWLLSLAGLALSTLAVSLAATWAMTAGLDGTSRTIAIELANLAAWGSLWVAQFVVLDRFLFRSAPAPAPASAPASARTPVPLSDQRSDEAA